MIDPQGYLYVSRHITHNAPNRSKARDYQIGSLVKLDPRSPTNPVIWSTRIGGYGAQQGILGTPALYKGILYVTVAEGGLVAVSSTTGRILWHMSLPGPTWMSPVPIDNNLLIGDCTGMLHDYDISSPTSPPRELWNIQLDGCIESTPAVWHRMIYVGSRGGVIYGIGQSPGKSGS